MPASARRSGKLPTTGRAIREPQTTAAERCLIFARTCGSGGVEGIDRLLIDLYAVFCAVPPNGPAHCHQDLAGMQDFEHRSERLAALGPTARSLHPWIEQ